MRSWKLEVRNGMAWECCSSASESSFEGGCSLNGKHLMPSSSRDWSFESFYRSFASRHETASPLTVPPTD